MDRKKKWSVARKFALVVLVLMTVSAVFDGAVLSLGLTQKVKAVNDIAESYTNAFRVINSDDPIPSSEKVETASQPETVVPEGKVVYLTFDDGPSKFTPKLLEILRKYDVKATFFVVNTKYVDLLPEMVAEGHVIGVHTESHEYQTIYSSEEAYFQDFKLMYDKVYELTGVQTTLMRFPGGSSNTVSSFNPGIMTRLSKLVTEYGLQYFDWNVDSMDATRAKTAKDVFEKVKAGLLTQNCSVVLQHDLYEFSVDAVEMIIQWGLENGYSFLPLEPSSPTCHQTIVN